MKRTLQTGIPLAISLTLFGCAATGPAPQPSPATDPTGYIRLQAIDTFYIGTTRPYVKRMDTTTQKWVTLPGEAGDVQELPAGAHQIGLVYSVAPPIIAWPKMGAAAPKPQHQVQVSIPKDAMLLSQFTIKSKAGGFAWDLTFGKDQVVMPSRNHPNAFIQLHELAERTVESDPHEQFGLALSELEQVADARSVAKLEALLAANPHRRVLLKRAIKRIRKSNR